MFVGLYKYLVNTRYTIQNRVAKGQIKPKAVWTRRRFSQKSNKRICFVCREKQKRKQNKFVHSFLGESKARISAYSFI